MRSLRWTFPGGITILGRPDPEKGEARFIQDGIYEAGRIRPASKPDAGTLLDVTGKAGAGNVVAGIWKRRARIFLTPELRRWAPVLRGGVEVDCFTPEGAPAGNAATTFPQKMVGSSRFTLGIPQPTMPPAPLGFSDPLKVAGILSSSGGHLNKDADYYYVALIKVNGGYLQTDIVHVTTAGTPQAPTDNVGDLINIAYQDPYVPAAGKSVNSIVSTTKDGVTYPANAGSTGAFKTTFSWVPPVGLVGYQGVALFRGLAARDEINLKLIWDADSAGVGYTDDGQKRVSDPMSLQDYKEAKGMAALPDTSQYVHTFAFSKAGYEVEGAPSQPSVAVAVGLKGGLKFDPAGDGFWDQPGMQTLTLNNMVLYGPCTRAEAFTSSSVILSGALARSQTVPGLVAAQGLGDAPAGLGCAASLAGVARPAVKVDFALVDNGDGTRALANQVRLPEWANPATFLTGTADTLTTRHGGTIQTWTQSLTAGLSGDVAALFLKAAAGTFFPMVTGEEILLYLADSEHKAPTNPVAYKVVRRNDDPSLIMVRGRMLTAWQGQASFRWARNLGYLPLGGFTATQEKLRPGTLVRIAGPFDSPRVFTAYPSGNGLYLAGDWSGYEYLNWTDVPITLTIDYYPENNGIVGRNVYRVNTGEYLLTKRLPLGQRTFQDTTPDTKLGDALEGMFTNAASGQSLLATPPPMDLRGLTAHLNALHGITKDTVRWTPPAKPDAWPEGYSFSPDSLPGALASFDSALIVLCRQRIFRLDGSPDSYSPTPTLAEDGLLAPGSVQVTPYGLIYLGARGICAFDGQRSIPLTDGKLTPAHLFPRWQTNPDGTTKAAASYQDTNRAGQVRTHLMDSLKGKGASWLAAFEDSALLNALTQDRIFGVAPAADSHDWLQVGSAYHRGRYYLYARSWQAPEGLGCWVLDLSQGKRLLHLGLQPIDSWVDGDDFWLLLNGDQ